MVEPTHAKEGPTQQKTSLEPEASTEPEASSESEASSDSGASIESEDSTEPEAAEPAPSEVGLSTSNSTIMEDSRRRLTNEAYTVACICPKGIEFAAVRAMLAEEHQSLPTSRDKNAYTLGRVGQHNVVIVVLPDVGNNSAAIAVAQLLDDFKSIRFGLLVGIGGGVPSSDKDIRLGDVVVGDPRGTSGGVVQFDRGKTLSTSEFEQTGSLDKPPAVLGEYVQKLISEHEMKDIYITKFLSAMLERFPMMKPKYSYQGEDNDQLFNQQQQVVVRSQRQSPEIPEIYYGIIGSSNQVIKDGETRDELQKSLGILCVEMEAAGLMDNFPCLVIRGISDYADMHKNNRWQPYAAFTATAYARWLLEIVPAEKVHNIPIVKLQGTSACSITIFVPVMKLAYVNCLIDCSKFLLLPDSVIRTENGQVPTAETCQWIEKHPTFKTWKNNTQSSLLIASGKLGCGKSVMAEHLRTVLNPFGTDGLAFFFNGRRENNEPIAPSMIRTLLFQILSRHSSIIHQQPFMEKYREIQERSMAGLDMSPEALNDLFLSLRFIKNDFTIYLVIDSLDGTESSDIAEVANMLKTLVSCNGSCKFKIFLTSRSTSGFLDHFPVAEYPHISLDSNSEHRKAIEEYVHDNVKSLRKNYGRKGLKTIGKTLGDSSDGVFLWAELVLRRLKKELEFGAPLSKLVKLPNEISGEMDEVYRKMLGNLSPERIQLQRIMLQWILFAERPLTREEFRIAVTINHNKYEQDKPKYSSETELDAEVDFETFEQQVRSHCGGLVELNHDRVQLIHPSAESYLLNHEDWWMSDVSREQAHHELATTCLGYLVFPSGGGPAPDTTRPTAYEDRLEELRFLKYASLHWSAHLNRAPTSAESEFQPEVKQLMEAESQTLLSIQMSRFERHLDFSLVVQLLHLVSELGHEKAVMLLLKEDSIDVNAKDNHDRTSLTLAAMNGHAKVVDLLLKHPGIDVNCKDDHDQAALLLAARNGYEEVVDLLLKHPGIDVNCKDNEDWAPLSLAAKYGHDQVVQKLLDCPDICVNIDSKGWTPLYLAAQRGYTEVVKRLSERTEDEEKNRLLLQAARDGSKTAATQLLDNGADVNANDSEERTPLYLAARENHVAIVRLLVKQGADIEKRNSHKQTLLHQAVSEGNKTAVELLIAAGADKNAKGRFGWSPLHEAVKLTRDDVELLLNNGAAMEVRDDQGKTPLHMAVGDGDNSIDIIELLMSSYADITTRDSDGHTLLHTAAASNSSVGTAITILKHQGPGKNARDMDGQTPLHVAAATGNLEVASLLLFSGANVEAEDCEKQTPLHVAARYGHSNMARLLVLEGANKAARDDEHQTPLYLAERKGHQDTVSMLQERPITTVRTSSTKHIWRILTDTIPFHFSRFQKHPQNATSMLVHL